MDSPELHHLLFRWLHVTAAVIWIGHIWPLVFTEHVHHQRSDDAFGAMSTRCRRGF